MTKVIIATSGKRWNITPCLVNVITAAALVVGAWIMSASIY